MRSRLAVVAALLSSTALAQQPPSFTITPNDQPEVLSVIDNTGTAVEMGTVDPTDHSFTGVGGTGGGGGGGPITIDDGADVAQGATAQAPCTAYNASGCTVIQLVRLLTKIAGQPATISDGTNGPVAVKPAGQSPLVADPSFTVALSPNSIGATKGSPVYTVPSGSNYTAIGPGQTTPVALTPSTGGTGGALGDYLSLCVIAPQTTSPGTVVIFDNATAIYTFVGGTSSVVTLISWAVPIGAASVSGAWKVETGASVTVFCSGKFS